MLRSRPLRSVSRTARLMLKASGRLSGASSASCRPRRPIKVPDRRQEKQTRSRRQTRRPLCDFGGNAVGEAAEC